MRSGEHLKNFKKTLIQRLTGGRFVYRFPVGSSLFLTFDDGPHAQHTPQIIAILKRFRAKATFFLVGRNVERYPDIVQQIRDNGHSIGLHTHSHKTLDRMTRPEFDREISLNQEAIHRAISQRPTLLRPPEGRLTLASLIWAMSSGLRVIHYTVTSNDWKANRTEDITDLFERTPVRGGNILSFHDNSALTVGAIPTLLERFARAGFTFQAIS